MYGTRSAVGKRLPAHKPKETAGFRWQPEMWPTAYAMVRTVKPKARETPWRPMPTLGKAAAKTALPHPPNTNHKVPINSAPSRLDKGMSKPSSGEFFRPTYLSDLRFAIGYSLILGSKYLRTGFEEALNQTRKEDSNLCMSPKRKPLPRSRLRGKDYSRKSAAGASFG